MVTALLAKLGQPPTVCVTVSVTALVNVLGFPVPASLHTRVPVTPVAVTVELPQLFTTDNKGADGVGLTVTVTSLVIGQLPTVALVTV